MQLKLLLFICVLIGLDLNAQELMPNFVTEYQSFLFTHLDTFYYDDVLADTLEDGKEWYPIYQTNFAEGSSSNISTPWLQGHYRTEDRKVYFTDAFTEGILYDFSLEAGDEVTVLPWGGAFSSSRPRVYLVDSTKYMNCVFNDSVKVLYVRPYIRYEEERFYPFNNVWIEGIGDTQHPFPPLSCFDGTSCEAINLSSQYYFEGTWYELWNSEGTAQLPCQEIITSTTHPLVTEPIGITPNPVRAGQPLRIATHDFTATRASLLGTADGRRVMDWVALPAGVGELVIPATVPPGVYVILLADGDGRLARGKVVVR